MMALEKPRQEVAYSASWSVTDTKDLVREVEYQFESWLRSKGTWDPPTEVSGYHISPGGDELLVTHRQSAEGRSARFKLTEAHDQGTWRSTVTVNSANGADSWIDLRVTNNVGIPSKVPRLALYLLEALELHDGLTWLAAKPARASLHDVERIAEEVTDIERRGLYFVAATDESLAWSAFADRVELWMQDTRGMAHVVVLDPEATREFAAVLGLSHAVQPWTIRTFDVDVDPAVPADGRRHRILGTRRLSESDGAVRGILGRVARTHAAQRPTPPRYASVDRALVRVEDRLLLEGLFGRGDRAESPVSTATPSDPPADLRTIDLGAAVEPAPGEETGASVSDRAAAYLTKLELVREVLGVEAIDRPTLDEVASLLRRSTNRTEATERITRELNERQGQLEELRAARDSLRVLSEDQELELAESLGERSRLTDEVRWLRRQLAKAASEDAYKALPREEVTLYPDSFGQLAEMLGQLEDRGVVFTGDIRLISTLEEHDTLGRVAGVAWDCLLALADYVRARGAGDHHQGLKQYLDKTPQGYQTVPPKKRAAGETKATMDAWGDQRVFKVPVDVDRSGECPMEAHFKLGLVGQVSPRMYYLDNYARDGKVYVGYIGAHLRNTKTN